MSIPVFISVYVDLCIITGYVNLCILVQFSEGIKKFMSYSSQQNLTGEAHQWQGRKNTRFSTGSQENNNQKNR